MRPLWRKSLGKDLQAKCKGGEGIVGAGGYGDENNRDNIQIINKDAALQNFLDSHPCCPVPPRPNTTIQFKITTPL
jgi:hypothetical protein